MAKLSSKNIGNIGMTFGIKDVTPDIQISKFKKKLFEKKNLETKELIDKFMEKIPL